MLLKLNFRCWKVPISDAENIISFSKWIWFLPTWWTARTQIKSFSVDFVGQKINVFETHSMQYLMSERCALKSFRFFLSKKKRKNVSPKQNRMSPFGVLFQQDFPSKIIKRFAMLPKLTKRVRFYPIDKALSLMQYHWDVIYRPEILCKCISHCKQTHKM